jgi:putative DNA primase/helicase
MNDEIPPPDELLKGKVKIIPFPKKFNGSGRNTSPCAAPPKPTGDEEEIARLSLLPKLAYERERDAAAKRLRIRPSVLDKLVAKKLSASREQKERSELFEPAPWHMPVIGTELLSAISDDIRRYVVTEQVAADAIALWIIHTYLLSSYGISPRLAITSPEKQCGKTTLLDVLSHLVLRPLSAANLSSAVVFRVAEAKRPTFLIDEADTFLDQKEELRGVLNAGHRKGGAVWRLVGDDHEPRCFEIFSACAIACIGKLTATLADRSIPISLRRRRPNETVEAFRFDRTERLRELASKAARWALDNVDTIRLAEPHVPPTLFNRAADNWRPLLTIAEIAGGEWSERARNAAEALMKVSGVDAQSSGVTLLSDIRAIFSRRSADRISSSDLVRELTEMDERPWPEWKHGKAITPTGVGRLLRPFRIVSGTIRTEAGTPKGYYLSQFEDAFDRYLLEEKP